MKNHRREFRGIVVWLAVERACRSAEPASESENMGRGCVRLSSAGNMHISCRKVHCEALRGVPPIFSIFFRGFFILEKGRGCT